MEMSMYQDNGSHNGKTQQLRRSLHLDFASGSTKQQKFQSLLASPDLLKLASPDLEKLLIAHQGMMTTTPTPTQFIFPKYVTDEQEAYARGFVEALAELHQHGQIPGGPNMPPPSSADSSDSLVSTYSTLMPMTSGTYSSASTSLSVTTAASALINMSAGAAGSSSGNNQRAPVMKHPFLSYSNLTKPNNNNSPASYGNVHVKEEPAASYIDQTVPGSPNASISSRSMTDSPALSPGSSLTYDSANNSAADKMDGTMPVDLDEQERIKLERKRARNRIAARKCRTRKMERISVLEDKVSDLKNKNNELAHAAASLNEQVVQLKQQLMDHMKSGCQIIMPNSRNLNTLTNMSTSSMQQRL